MTEGVVPIVGRWPIDPVAWPGLSDALDTLGSDPQRAVELVYFQGRTVAEASSLMAVGRHDVAVALVHVHRVVARHLLSEVVARTIEALAPTPDAEEEGMQADAS